MVYRQIGKTGLEAGIIGLGCEHLDNKPYEVADEVINAALEQGINVFDVFMPGRPVRENIAKALGSRRKDVLIQGHIGSTDVGQQYDISRDLPTVQKYFEDLLRIFGGYIDLGMMFFIDSDEDYKGVFETGFANYVQRLKRNGDIRHIGFSSHNPVTAIRAIETGLPEMMMFSVNAAFDLYPASQYVLDSLENGLDPTVFNGMDPKRAELYRLCEQKDVGITVMKAYGAGKLLSPEHTPFEKPMTSAQCIHYALTRPAVASVLPGCQSRDQVLDTISYLDADDQARDYMPILGALKNDFRGACVYCGHCRPCPVEIDVASVHKYLDIAKLDENNIPPSIRSHYAALSHHGEECTGCGSCESRCPFGVPVIGNMAEATRIFG